MSQKTFEIGLVMAGAISAGAYTAGVMDFLIEALDAYEAAKAQPGWDGPTHAVRVPLMAGASAGGMTSAMAALQAFHDIDHVQPGAPPPAPNKNRLYSNWVSRIDLEELLKTSDLDGKEASEGVQSALCCTILDKIVHETFTMSGPAKARAWLGRGEDRSIRVLVTLTNVRGVPYSFEVFGSEPLPYPMLNHGDYLDFKVGTNPPPEAGSAALDIGQTNTPGWEVFRTAALATGAFPIGLAPRRLEKAVADYDHSLRVGRDSATGFQTIKPDGVIAQADPYAFTSVDGGTIDNEPLEIARRLLAGGGELASDGERADKALVLIAPFPAALALPEDASGLRIIELLPHLATTLIQQSRFKPDELSKAADEAFFSRFLISPERDGNGSQAAQRYPIASGVLNGFGGFIHESFRRHDYLLGRRNAQAFLRFHFALPQTHPLFDGVANRQKWFVNEPSSQGRPVGTRKTFATKTTGETREFGLPIIPICGDLATEIVIPAADLPKPDAVDRDRLGTLIDARVEKVMEVLVDHDLLAFTKDTLFGPVLRLGARHYLAHVAATKAKATIAEALDAVRAAFA